MNKATSNFLKLVTSIALPNLVGGIGALFTISAVSSWYVTLTKPFFSPPNWIFGPVWTTLYVMMGISLYLVWKQGLENRHIRSAFVLFIVHLFVNGAWSILFFGFQEPFLAFIDIIILLGMIMVLIFKFWPINKIASILLLPYLLWVSFATLLNYSIWQLN